MIYLDNSATTYPKPESVRKAVSDAIEQFGGNPGRGGHTYAMKIAEKIFSVRILVGEMFGVSPERVIFTKNCTESLNLAIGSIPAYTEVITTDLEHNAVIRPLEQAAGKGKLRYRILDTGADGRDTVNRLSRMVSPKTSAVVMTAASNVTGQLLPIAAVGAFCRKHGLIFIVDAAQAAGMIPIDCNTCGIDFLCMSGHKGLYGITGTGLLLSSGKYLLQPLLFGGTGTNSLSLQQSGLFPEDYEAGTLPTVGICALEAGLRYLQEQRMDSLTQHSLSLCQKLYHALKQMPQVKIYSAIPIWGNSVPIVSFAIDGIPSETAADMLSDRGFALRGGYQCAAVSHRKLGTTSTGVIRCSPSSFNTIRQMQDLSSAVFDISSKIKNVEKRA